MGENQGPRNREEEGRRNKLKEEKIKKTMKRLLEEKLRVWLRQRQIHPVVARRRRKLGVESNNSRDLQLLRRRKEGMKEVEEVEILKETLKRFRRKKNVARVLLTW